jgi:microcin C transport system permease protein
MRDYFLRRFLLIPPTLLGISFVVFLVTRAAPGGPIEQAMMQMQQMSEEGNSGGQTGTGLLDEAQRKDLERYYGLDKPVVQSYFIWLGLGSRELSHKEVEFKAGETKGSVRVRLVEGEAKKKRMRLERVAGGNVVFTNVEEFPGNWKWRKLDPKPNAEEGSLRVEVFREEYSGLVQGDLGRSFRYGKPVEQVIWDRLPVSTYFGLMTMLIVYAVCLPLGFYKAIYHNSWFDNTTSVLIFMGYAIPGYVLGFLLILFCAVNNEWFPTTGFTSIGFDEMSTGEKIKDVLHHSVLPLCAYLVGGFAFVTMLMKNHLMDNLAADYMRTALSKGVAYRDAVWRHALRNSMIPIATNLGHQVMLFVSGSFLIEKIFDINGFGLLGFNAIIDRDFPVVMGVLMLSAFLMLLGNVISDFLMAMVDPRVRFK